MAPKEGAGALDAGLAVNVGAVVEVFAPKEGTGADEPVFGANIGDATAVFAPKVGGFGPVDAGLNTGRVDAAD